MADIQTLEARVRALDYTLQNAVVGAEPAVVTALAALVADPSEEVRELAILCLVATADPAVAPTLAAAVHDPDLQVAMAAARGLRECVSAAVLPDLLRALAQVDEPMVRRELGLVIGTCGSDAERPALKALWQREGDPEAHAGLTAGLARLGDEDARTAFAGFLRQSAGAGRRGALELAEIIGQPWLLPVLADLLDDTSDVLRVAIDARPDLIPALRGCDLAVVLIARISGARFSFPVTRAQNYAAAQLDEVRRFVHGLAP